MSYILGVGKIEGWAKKKVGSRGRQAARESSVRGVCLERCFEENIFDSIVGREVTPGVRITGESLGYFFVEVWFGWVKGCGKEVEVFLGDAVSIFIDEHCNSQLKG